VLCAVMLRGRHRGLPVALDRAVRLPGWDEDDDEEGVSDREIEEEGIDRERNGEREESRRKRSRSGSLMMARKRSLGEGVV